VKAGDTLLASDRGVPISPGNAAPLSQLPLGSKINSLELRPGRGAQAIRGAGTFGTVMGREDGSVSDPAVSVGNSRKTSTSTSLSSSGESSTGGSGSGGEARYTLVKMPSGEVRRVLSRCYATLGAVGNHVWNRQVLGKAGAKRWRGWRSGVRGVAMNPVDHPHGGGEGKTGTGGPPKTPWGKPAHGGKTRKKKNYVSDRWIVTPRRKAREQKRGA